jgi:hypothetical protein
MAHELLESAQLTFFMERNAELALVLAERASRYSSQSEFRQQLDSFANALHAYQGGSHVMTAWGKAKLQKQPLFLRLDRDAQLHSGKSGESPATLAATRWVKITEVSADGQWLWVGEVRKGRLDKVGVVFEAEPAGNGWVHINNFPARKNTEDVFAIAQRVSWLSQQ